jgi:hypothetical protein
MKMSVLGLHQLRDGSEKEMNAKYVNNCYHSHQPRNHMNLRNALNKELTRVAICI